MVGGWCLYCHCLYGMSGSDTDDVLCGIDVVSVRQKLGNFQEGCGQCCALTRYQVTTSVTYTTIPGNMCLTRFRGGAVHQPRLSPACLRERV
ncbi:hypothetical protein CQJ27_25460 [Escherichia sp. E1130]|nr:hypothetical protein CQJ27_25460 [Escherichia sp. E1130]TLI63092.1 hypothetical protein FEK66_23255 [Escherichia sp. E1130]